MLGRDVVAAAESAGHDVIALARARPRHHRRRRRPRRRRRRPPRRGRSTAPRWTDVDGAEAEEEAATRINGDGAGNLAAAAPFLVHVSSDYVFDGTATEPYTEGRPHGSRAPPTAAPSSRASTPSPSRASHAIVRTAWVFGPHGKNFVATMLKLAEDRDEVNVVADQIGCPTFTGHLAPALVEIAEQRLTGILHVAGGGQCSWQELAQAAFEEAGTGTTANPVTTAEFPRPAPRPAWSVLRSTRPRRARAARTGATA